VTSPVVDQRGRLKITGGLSDALATHPEHQLHVDVAAASSRRTGEARIAFGRAKAQFVCSILVRLLLHWEFIR